MQAVYPVGTISNALYGKKVLADHGVRAYVRRTSADSSANGCGYSLLIPQDSPQVAQWLRMAGVTRKDHKGRGTP